MQEPTIAYQKKRADFLATCLGDVFSSGTIRELNTRLSAVKQIDVTVECKKTEL